MLSKAAWLVAFLIMFAQVALGQSLPGYETRGLDQLSEESYSATEAQKRAAKPFEEWRTSAYIVLATLGNEFIEVRNPPHGSREIRHFLKKGRRKNRWSLQIWEGEENVLSCGWKGDKAIGIFVVSIAKRQVWECGEKEIDESFFRVSQADPLWADVAGPATVGVDSGSTGNPGG